MNKPVTQMISQKEEGSIIRAIWFCFFISGAAGLIYQILWIRMLGLIFGHTVHAITTVLVVFMGGLALGSYLFGRKVDRYPRLLWIYGILEIGIGLYCLLIPFLMAFVEKLYTHWAGPPDSSLTGFTFLQFIIIFPVLLIPTTLMGATLPVLSRFFVRDMARVGQKIGRLYAFNTAGAVLGTVMAGFLLLPILGMTLTLLFAATLNLGVGTLILQFDRRLVKRQPGNPNFREGAPGFQGSRPAFVHWGQIHWAVVIGFAFSGAAAMVYEIAWTRALTLVIGSSTYAYSVMLLSFLVGIAVGSAIYSRLTRKGSVGPEWFLGLQVAIGISAAVVFPLINRLPGIFLWGFSLSRDYGFILLFQILISISVMILPTLLIGATFPCVAQIVSRNFSHLGEDIGKIYAFNTCGAILGSFAAGFILIPAIGIGPTIKTAILINLLIGLGLFLFLAPKRMIKFATVPVMAAVVLVIVYLPAWSKEVMTSGVAIYGGRSSNTEQTTLENYTPGNVMFYKDGISSTVSVHKNGEKTFLRVNGKTDASNGFDMQTQLMSGHIPALLHRGPASALVIGLGSGVTTGALAQYPLSKLDVVEIEPAVVTASDFFKEENRNVLKDPRVKLYEADARNFLLRTRERYDLIVSEPSNPWIGGTAALFTVEFFELLREHLNPGGLMLQWLQGYSLKPDDVRMIVASFREVFPSTSLWMASNNDYLIVGGEDPLRLDLGRIRSIYKNNPAFKEDLDRIDIPFPEVIMGDFMLDHEDLGRFAEGAELNTDDLLPLEFSAPKSLYENTAYKVFLALLNSKKSGLPAITGADPKELENSAFYYQLALRFQDSQRKKEALEALDKSISYDPKNLNARLERGKLLVNYKKGVSKAIEDFNAAMDIDPEDPRAYYNLGRVYEKTGQKQSAVGFLEKAVRKDPENSGYRLALAKIYRETKNFERAIKEYRSALEIESDNYKIMGALAAVLIQEEAPREAIRVLEQAIKLEPNDDKLLFQMGQANLMLDEIEGARKYFESAIEANSRHVSAHVGLGKTLLALGSPDEAFKIFEKAKKLNPGVEIPRI